MHQSRVLRTRDWQTASRFASALCTALAKAKNIMDAPYEDDPTHPIPFVGHLDVEVQASDGPTLGVVIASPLGNDERSMQRLVKKLEVYVGEFESLRSKWRAQGKGLMRAELAVSIHPGSHAEIFDVINRYRPWVEAQSIILQVSTKSAGFGVQ